MKMADFGAKPAPAAGRAVAARPAIDIVCLSLNHFEDQFRQSADVILCLDFDKNLEFATGVVRQIRQRLAHLAYAEAPVVIVAIPEELSTMEQGRVSEALEQSGAMVVGVKGSVDSSNESSILHQVRARFKLLDDWAPPKPIPSLR